MGALLWAYLALQGHPQPPLRVAGVDGGRRCSVCIRGVCILVEPGGERNKQVNGQDPF